ncbi:Aha1 domain-containing protein [Naegleria gruberi]|uniref:Aha1 domain-containing protein n=1 Tax=Naegleria gruberi TaxID=5762 RepID=D2V0Y4_NAEGR|nr:Aha1 domain-containing protein [Naegleria gruberi]EFC49807.1 Aha1 domain-containing protein [Naegleria gruberi]|eukprot:XP_002682551.1 Aha1 domain-containing protein [Naegleria gruberi strain NEG-M]
MAKEGEGDDRWIVNDLGVTGRNVGRWHWTDEDVLPWCKDQLKSLLKKVECYSEGNMKITTTTVSHVKGEASVMNRKRKLISIFELDVEIGWSGYILLGEASDLSDTDSEKCIVAKGKIKIPYLSQEIDQGESFEINVDLDTSCKKNEHKVIKETLRTKGLETIKTIVNKFLLTLRDGANIREKYQLWEQQEQEIVKKVNSSNNLSESGSTSNRNVTESIVGIGGAHVKEDQKKKVEIHITERFVGAPLPKIFEMLTEPNIISHYTQSRAESDKRAGGKFSLFGGKVRGEFIEFIPNEKIVQKWRFEDWPENDYSTVTISFENRGGGETIVKLDQVGIPYKDSNGYFVKEKVQSGWETNFFQRLKVLTGQVIGSSGF